MLRWFSRYHSVSRKIEKFSGANSKRNLHPHHNEYQVFHHGGRHFMRNCIWHKQSTHFDLATYRRHMYTKRSVPYKTEWIYTFL